MKYEIKEKELLHLTAPIILKVFGIIGILFSCILLFEGVDGLKVNAFLIPLSVILNLFAFNEMVVITEQRIVRRSWIRKTTSIFLDEIVQVEFTKLRYILLFTDQKGNKLSVPTNLRNINVLLHLVHSWTEETK